MTNVTSIIPKLDSKRTKEDMKKQTEALAKKRHDFIYSEGKYSTFNALVLELIEWKLPTPPRKSKSADIYEMALAAFYEKHKNNPRLINILKEFRPGFINPSNLYFLPGRGNPKRKEKYKETKIISFKKC